MVIESSDPSTLSETRIADLLQLWYRRLWKFSSIESWSDETSLANSLVILNSIPNFGCDSEKSSENYIVSESKLQRKRRGLQVFFDEALVWRNFPFNTSIRIKKCYFCQLLDVIIYSSFFSTFVTFSFSIVRICIYLKRIGNK